MPAFAYGPRDFPEDAIKDEDNGAYSNMCLLCRTRFIGHKRRNVCKTCTTPKPGDVLLESPLGTQQLACGNRVPVENPTTIRVQ